MTDLNSIASNVNANAAKNGVNSDITALTALTSITSSVSFTSATLINPIIVGGTATGLALDSTSTVVTAPVNTNSTEIASTAFVNQVAFNAALPAQPGDTVPRFLSTLSGIASWISIPIIPVARNSNIILDATNNGNWVNITSGTFTQTFTAAATVGKGWWCYLSNGGTGDITIPSSDGFTNWIMYPGEARIFVSTGTGYVSLIITSFYRTYIATGTFVTPPGYPYIAGRAWSAGSSGQKSAGATTASFGGGGGGCADFMLPIAVLGSSQTITIGAGGAGVTVTANGNIGGTTSVGSLFSVFPGATYVAGGSVFLGLVTRTTTNNLPGVGYEGGIGGGNDAGVNAVWGGAGGTTFTTQTASGNSIYGAGAGGGCNTSGAAFAGGTSVFAGAGGASSSASAGTAGTAPGGGGGATQTGPSSGAGARGEVRLWGVL